MPRSAALSHQRRIPLTRGESNWSLGGEGRGGVGERSGGGGGGDVTDTSLQPKKKLPAADASAQTLHHQLSRRATEMSQGCTFPSTLNGSTTHKKKLGELSHLRATKRVDFVEQPSTWASQSHCINTSRACASTHDQLCAHARQLNQGTGAGHALKHCSLSRRHRGARQCRNGRPMPGSRSNFILTQCVEATRPRWRVQDKATAR